MLKFRSYANELPRISLPIARQFANCYLWDIIARPCAGTTRWLLLITNAQRADDHSSRDNKQQRCNHSETGRPSIDPELLLRILLIGYLYGITSERRLVEELRMHLAWRWFTGLGFDQEIPHHSTFSKNRHGRFQESKLFERLFEQIVGTQESDRVAPLAPPQTEVRAGAVLPGSGGAEHQATGALPQS